MTSKQKFIETFLKCVYGFDDVRFVLTYSGCMLCQGLTYIKVNTPSKSVLLKPEPKIERTRVDVWVDKNKTTGWTIKFKTDSIPEDMFDIVKARAEYLCPGAVVDIYSRTHAYSRNADIPTLRLRVSELPW